MTGTTAPVANATNELAAAIQGDPNAAGSSPSSSRASVSMAELGFDKIRSASSSAWPLGIPLA